MKVKIKTALISVSDKQGLEKIARYLLKNDISKVDILRK